MKLDEKGLLEQKYAAIPKTVKAAFFSCFFMGFLVHLYAFTNIIPNSDGLSRVYDAQQMTISGRWFLHYASMFHGYIQAPALIGGLSVLFLSLAAALTADTLNLRSTVTAALCGTFLVAVPAMAYTYLYMFTASAYAFGILLAVIAVWLTRRFDKGFLLAAIPLACCVGTYQAYFAVAAALAVICVILDLLDEKQDLKQAFVRAVKLVVMLGLGAVLYYVMLELFLYVKDLELLNYRGIGSVGSGLSIAGLLRSVLSAYKQFLIYFLVPGSTSYITVPMTAAQICLFLAAGIALVCLCIRKKMTPGRLVLLFLMLMLVPLACNFTQLLSGLSPNMCYAFVFAYILPLVLIDRAGDDGWKGYRPAKTAACALSMAILLLCAQICNIAYTSSATAHRATEAFAANLVGRVESTPGYDRDMEVVIIGAFPDDVYYSDIQAFELVEHYSCLSSTVLDLNKHVYYYLNDWLNVPWEEPEEALMISISQSEAFQSMPLYPSDGSVQILDGRVVVKLAESYKPKQAYEIAYEQRR